MPVLTNLGTTDAKMEINDTNNMILANKPNDNIAHPQKWKHLKNNVFLITKNPILLW